MPHNIEDLAALLGVAGVIVTFIAWLVNIWIVRPLGDKISELNGHFSSLNDALVKNQSEFDLLAQHVNSHDVTLATHGEQIHTLFNSKGEKN